MDTPDPVHSDTVSTTVPRPRPPFMFMAIGLVIVFVLAAAGWLVWSGNWRSAITFFEKGSSANTFSQTQATPTIEWKSFIGAQPVAHIPVQTTQNYNEEYTIYDVGTFTSGAHTGSHLMLALDNINSPYMSPSNVPPQVTTYFQYYYFLGDAAGTPLGWWNRYGALVNSYYRQQPVPPELKLLTTPELAGSEFPATLPTFNATTLSDSAGEQVAITSNLNFPLTTPQPVGTVTVEGKQLVTLPLQNPDTFFLAPKSDYYVQLPFGGLLPATLVADFFTDPNSGVPQLSWSVGSTTVARYNYGAYAYGWSDCFVPFTSLAQLQTAFIQTGTTKKGDPLYEVDPAKYPPLYQCLYQKTQRHDYDPTTGQVTDSYPTTYDQFITTHPIFFWKHPYAGVMPFVREDIVPAAEKAKPVIYLYPQHTEQVQVQVAPVGGFTKTVPAYGNGWNVEATPQGSLTNLADHLSYPYLFWEGGREGTVTTPSQGFVVARAQIPTLLSEKLTLLGLNAKERNDFIEFWTPRLSKAPFYFITFISRSEIDRVAPLTVHPAPDTVIRVLMDYHPLAAPTTVDPLPLSAPVRTGFTVVEWGGIVRD